MELQGKDFALTGILPKSEFQAKAAWGGAGIFSRPSTGCGVIDVGDEPENEAFFDGEMDFAEDDDIDAEVAARMIEMDPDDQARMANEPEFLSRTTRNMAEWTVFY